MILDFFIIDSKNLAAVFSETLYLRVYPVDILSKFLWNVPASIYLLKVNNRNTRTRRRSGVFIDNFEHISHLVLVFLLLKLNM